MAWSSKMRASRSFTMLRNTRLITQCHTAEETTFSNIAQGVSNLRKHIQLDTSCICTTKSRYGLQWCQHTVWTCQQQYYLKLYKNGSEISTIVQIENYWWVQIMETIHIPCTKLVKLFCSLYFDGGLFNYTVDSSGHTAPNRRWSVNNELESTWKEKSCPHLTHNTSICPEWPRKNQTRQVRNYKLDAVLIELIHFMLHNTHATRCL